jgi:hypothetical protein
LDSVIVDAEVSVKESDPYTKGDAGVILQAKVAYLYPEEGMEE